MTYMRWAKTHPRVRYELTDSGVPGVERHEFDTLGAPVNLRNIGPYGDPKLISALARRYRVAEPGIVPVPGASSGIFIALAVAANAGAKVLLEQPTYEPIRLAAEFLHLSIEWLRRDPLHSFDVNPDDIEMGLDEGATTVVLCNLHNPSGRAIKPEAMRAIVKRCERANATLIVDEAYLDAWSLNAEQPCWTAASLGDNVIAINSLTKIYGLSGLRAGWLATSPRLADRARDMMDLLSVNNAAPAMTLAVSALHGIGRMEERFRRLYSAGQPIFRDWLAREPRVQGYTNDGAIFECIRLPQGLSGGRLNELLVAEYDTQVTPGAFFDLDDHIRLSLTLTPDDLTAALTNISSALDRLTQAT